MKSTKFPVSVINELRRPFDMPEIRIVLDTLHDSGGHVAFYAGAVRDALLRHETGNVTCQPRDLDIGVQGISRRDFDGLMCEFGGTKNRYGGYKLVPYPTLQMDIWRLEDTLGLHLTKTPFVSVENVLRTFVLDCNATAYDPYREIVYDLGAQQAIRNRRIGLLHRALLHSKGIFAAKAICLRLRFGLNWTTDTEFFAKQNCTPITMLHELSKLPLEKPERLALAEILNERSRFKYESRRFSTVAESALDSIRSLQPQSFSH